jgi:hypothetical protein
MRGRGKRVALAFTKAVGAVTVFAFLMVALPKLWYGRSSPRESPSARAQTEMHVILFVACQVQDETGRWPRSLSELLGRHKAPMLESYPKDPWGNDYVYEAAEDRVVVKCLGSDGEEGGEGDATDLVLDKPIPPAAHSKGASNDVTPKW